MTRQRLHFAMPRPVPPGLWRRVPPAIFPPVLGGLGLALAWIGGVGAFALPPALAEALAGMIVAIAAFCLVAYAIKLVRRPGVLGEELSILPGRAGVAAGVLAIYLLAAVIGVLASRIAGLSLLVAGIALHGGLTVMMLLVWRNGPAEQRRVTPVWHLLLTGWIVAARAALLLGWPALAGVLVWPTGAVAVAIYALSLRQFLAARVPEPLRPMLAIHLAPVALFGTVSLGLGWSAAGTVLAWLALAALAALFGCARWLLAAGYSPLWGALTFPAAATSGLWAALWRSAPTELNRLIAGALLVTATLIVVPVLFAVLRDWARGRLPVKTNAAIA